MTTATASAPNIQTSVIRGIIGGIAGGIVFGMMMAMMNMLPMVGMLIGNDSAIVGFGVHMVISIVFGAVYGVVATRIPSSWGVVVGVGVVYGVILWVAGALVIMPLMLGMNEMVLQIGEMQWQSLMGHVIFGVILTIVYKVQSDRK
ncbi:MAG: DUF1440 domain-containing protein [Phototrophicales bacterium]|nr:DUF1440 domain-containing protein [Phototrophicales bacterium]